MDEVSPHGQGPGCEGDSTEEVQRLSLPNLMSDVVEHQLYMYGAAGMHPLTIANSTIRSAGGRDVHGLNQ